MSNTRANPSHICYTGIGSVKSGNHTKKQYLAIMNKQYRRECAAYIKSFKCKSCKKSQDMNTREVVKQLNAKLNHKTYKLGNKTEQKIVKQMDTCRKCKNNNTKRCNTNNYIKFSGANLGKCPKSGIF